MLSRQLKQVKTMICTFLFNLVLSGSSFGIWTPVFCQGQSAELILYRNYTKNILFYKQTLDPTTGKPTNLQTTTATDRTHKRNKFHRKLKKPSQKEKKRADLLMLRPAAPAGAPSFLLYSSTLGQDRDGPLDGWVRVCVQHTLLPHYTPTHMLISINTQHICTYREIHMTMTDLCGD